jgi:hypothetical protein
MTSTKFDEFDQELLITLQKYSAIGVAQMHSGVRQFIAVMASFLIVVVFLLDRFDASAGMMISVTLSVAATVIGVYIVKIGLGLYNAINIHGAAAEYFAKAQLFPPESR